METGGIAADDESVCSVLTMESVEMGQLGLGFSGASSDGGF